MPFQRLKMLFVRLPYMHDGPGKLFKFIAYLPSAFQIISQVMFFVEPISPRNKNHLCTLLFFCFFHLLENFACLLYVAVTNQATFIWSLRGGFFSQVTFHRSKYRSFVTCGMWPVKKLPLSHHAHFTFHQLCNSFSLFILMHCYDYS